MLDAREERNHKQKTQNFSKVLLKLISAQLQSKTLSLQWLH